MGEDQGGFDHSRALRLLEAGWRQGSLFRPEEDLPGFDPQAEWLVVCTQSCSIVSESLAKDPHVEVAVAKELKSLNARAPQATGKDVRRFHLPVSGRKFQAVEIDINRRHFLPRQVLLDISAGRYQAEESAVRAMAGWLARYYSRIALPNELVRRAKLRLFPAVSAALQTEWGAGRLHVAVPAIYVKWEPNDEVGEGSPYKVTALFLCKDRGVADALGGHLGEPLAPFEDEGGHDGIEVNWESVSIDETFMSAVDGFSRLTEWDYLSDLGELASSP